MDLGRSSALLIAGMYCLLERAFSSESAWQLLSIKFLSPFQFPLSSDPEGIPAALVSFDTRGFRQDAFEWVERAVPLPMRAQIGMRPPGIMSNGKRILAGVG
jgi:hypothetical protein